MSTMWFLLAIAATAVAIIVSLGFVNGPLARIPGPAWVIPLIGETAVFAQDPVSFMYSRFKRYGPVFRAQLFGQSLVVVGDEKIIKAALSSTTDASSTIPMRSVAKIVDLYNMSDPKRHLIFRRTMSLALTPANIKSRLPEFAGVISQHLQAMQAAGTFELDDKLRRLVMNLSIGPINGFQLDAATMARLVDKAMAVQGGLFAAPVYLPGTHWFKAMNTRPSYVAMLREAVRARFPVDASGRVLGLSTGRPGLDSTDALVQEFSEAQDPLDVDKMAERVVQNVLGASETTSGLMLGCIVMAMSTPGLQDKLRAEQRLTASAHGEELSYEVLTQQLPLLDATVRETLRVLPPSHGVFRHTNVDLVLGEHHVPKGSMVLVSLDLLNCLQGAEMDRDAKQQQQEAGGVPACCNYQDLPTAFNPERWLVDPSEWPRLHAFGYGAHTCLGMHVAVLETKLVLSSMLRAGSWQLLNKNPRFAMIPWLRLTNGAVKLRFEAAP